MKKDLISVIIPCWNVERFLEDSVKCLKAQTYQDFEAIYVNDGSTDNIVSTLENLFNGDKRFKLISQENMGPSVARNTGVKSARGEFLAFFDADDFYGPQILEVMHNLITKHNSDCSMCQRVFVKEDFKFKKIKKQKIKTNEIVITDKTEIFAKYMAKKLGFGVLNKLYRHESLKKLDRYPDIFTPKMWYGEDIEMNVNFLDVVDSVVYLDQDLYYHRNRAGSLVKSNFAERKLMIFDGIDKAIELCEEKYPKALVEAKSCKTIFCLEMLYRIGKSDYANHAKTTELYDYYENNLKTVSRAKNHNIFQRMFFKFSAPYIKSLIKKKLKK